MSDDIDKVYTVNLRQYRMDSNKSVRDIEKSYSLLKDKNTKYARIIKDILDLNKSVAEIYNNAPDEFFDDQKPF